MTYKPYSKNPQLNKTKAFPALNNAWTSLSKKFDMKMKDMDGDWYLKGWDKEDFDKEYSFPTNFLVVKRDLPFLLIEHQITKERKWVSTYAINNENIENAFYDADQHFNPGTNNKRRK